MKNNYLIILFLVLTKTIYLSQSICTNADFESGTFQNWVGQYGTCCVINTPTNGLVTAAINSPTNIGQHVIMTGNGLDPNSCGEIPVVAPGSTYSARLGNSESGNGAERLRYTFNITPENTLIIYKYAVILENPSNHSVSEQPRFEAKLLNQNGSVIPCTYYYVAAGPGSGFQDCGEIQYKNWTTIGVDVTPYIGQNVTLDFATGDCDLGAHFGYAYVDAGCAPFLIDSRYCEVQNGLNIAVLTAPAGFQSYQWSNGGTGSTNIIINPQQGQVITCQITSVNGCVANLQATLTPSNVTASYMPGSVCSGDTLNLANNSVFENAIQDSVSWVSSDGFTSNTTDFSHVFSSPGTYQVELFVQSDVGCVDSVSQTVTIHELPIADITFADICVGGSAQATSNSSIADNTTLTNFWAVEGVQSSGNSVNIPYVGTDTIAIQLISISSNNCSDTTSESIIIYDNPVADFSFTETCQDVPIDFTNSSTVNALQNLYHWIYDGSEISTNADFSNQFSTVGQNSITLIVEDVYPTATCLDTLTQNFFVHALPTIVYVADTTNCEDLAFSYTNQSSVITGETLTYRWDINGNQVATTQNLTYTLNDSGIYPVTLTATSSFGCESDTTFNMYIYPTPEEPILAVSTPICPGDPITFSAQGEPNSLINWVGPSNFSSEEFSFTMPINIDQMGWYTAFLTSEYGCISDTNNIYASILYIYNFDDFDFPNVITPNGDGLNDELDLQSYFKTCEKFTMYIINRWGNIVYEQRLNSTPFSGKTKEGLELEEGVYFYKLLVSDSTDDKGVKSGFIHVIR
jgi:gliding motility-associated-like protein